MNQHVALDVALVPSTPERKVKAYLLALCFFILVVAILAIAALVSDRSLTPDQRIEVFQLSGLYP
jgi:hypothetical protein